MKSDLGQDFIRVLGQNQKLTSLSQGSVLSAQNLGGQPWGKHGLWQGHWSIITEPKLEANRQNKLIWEKKQH